MKTTQAVTNITNHFNSVFGINLAFNFVPGAIFNPIMRSYRDGAIDIDYAVNVLLEQYNDYMAS